MVSCVDLLFARFADGKAGERSDSEEWRSTFSFGLDFALPLKLRELPVAFG